MHGTIMVFLAVVPLAVGAFGNYLVPLQLGAAEMAFPRMNMASFWAYATGGAIMLASFFVPGGPTGAGWTLYPPQAISAGTPGSSWGILLMLASLATLRALSGESGSTADSVSVGDDIADALGVSGSVGAALTGESISTVALMGRFDQ
jgi:heme/copper-type cytochrome/quinol oxidase subunit 1